MKQMSKNHLMIFHTDNGGKYTFKLFSNYLKNERIRYEFRIPKNSKQNGALKGFIEFWHIECIRLILIGAHLSYKL